MRFCSSSLAESKAFRQAESTACAVLFCTVVLSEQPLDESALRAAIEATGYEFVSADSHPVPEKKGLFGKLFG